MPDAAMLWTGGKDSALALHEAAQNGYRVRCLVTFAPPEPSFLAHPLPFMQLQAEALGLPHRLIPICEPFAAGYETSLRKLRDEGLDAVVTGDIAEVGGSPNWIRERSRPVGMQVHTPLWGRDRGALLHELIRQRFKVIFSCIKTRWLDPAWIGRTLDHVAIAELSGIRERNGLDLCGEEGEYHTLVTDGPQFARPIDIQAFSTRAVDSIAYLEIHQMKLGAK